VIFDWFYGLDMQVLYPVTIILIAGAAELGNWIGLRFHVARTENADVGTLAGASLGLLALLIAFSFSMAESRYDLRRSMVLEEANAIGSTANFALIPIRVDVDSPAWPSASWRAKARHPRLCRSQQGKTWMAGLRRP
jgi:hypothetical protein